MYHDLLDCDPNTQTNSLHYIVDAAKIHRFITNAAAFQRTDSSNPQHLHQWNRPRG